MRVSIFIGAIVVIVATIVVCFENTGSLRDKEGAPKAAVANLQAPTPEVSKKITSGAKTARPFLFNGNGTISDEALARGDVTSKQVAAIMAAQARAVRQLVELDVQNSSIKFDRNSRILTGVVKLYPKEGQAVTDRYQNELREILGEDILGRYVIDGAPIGNGIAFELCYAGLTNKSFSLKVVDCNVNVVSDIILEMPNPIDASNTLPFACKTSGIAKNIEDLAKFQISLREIVVRKSDFRF